MSAFEFPIAVYAKVATVIAGVPLALLDGSNCISLPLPRSIVFGGGGGGGECSCENYDWLVQDNDLWGKYFVFSGEKRMLSSLAPSYSCSKHLNMIWRITESRECCVCMDPCRDIDVQA